MVGRSILVALVLALFCAGGVAVPQEAGAPKDSPRQSNLKNPVDSWYKIVVSGQHTGYVRTSIRPDGDGYQYMFEMEGTTEAKGVVRSFSYSGNALLNGEGVPQRATMTLTVGNDQINFVLSVEGGLKRIRGEEVGKKGPDLEWTYSVDEDLYIDAQNALFSIKMRGGAEKLGRKAVKIVYPNRATPLHEATIEMIGPRQEEYLDKKVDTISGQFGDRFVMFPGFEARKYFVDAYGRFLEVQGQKTDAGKQGESDYSTVILVENAVQAIGALETIRESGRRHPFDKPYAMSQKAFVPAEKGEETPVQQKPTHEKPIDRLMREMEQVVKEMEATGEKDKRKKLDEQFTKQESDLRRLAPSDAVLKLAEQYRKRIRAVYDSSLELHNEAKFVRDSIEKGFQRTTLSEMGRLLAKLQEIARDPRVLGTDVEPKIKKYVADVEQLYQRKQVQEDLNKMRSKFAITGILYHLRDEPFDLAFEMNIMGYPLEYSRTVYLPVSDSYAIINGKTIRKGDLIVGCLVKEIEENGVVVMYKGEECKITFHKN
ncbi:MAG: hypothetical protein A2Z34_09695 [Planctomycetes bacterium RBG_16_59_8]|nr:MAG: hypothetical protein A2Z34_09695 [Planctomycetes bacterium RBG_16_59_8]